MTMKLPMATTALLLVALLLPSIQFTEAQLGICYGTQSNQLPCSQDVVSLYQSNGVGIMRIYDVPYEDILQAVQGSGIKVVLGFNNDMLQSFASDASMAMEWLQTNVSPYASSIKYIVAGNEVLTDQDQYVGPAMNNFISALNSMDLCDIQVTTAIRMPAMEVPFPPSLGKFKDNDLPFLQQVVSILESNGSPLFLNVFPYFAYSTDSKIDVDYALGNPNAPPVQDTNNGNIYHSLFDAELDSVYAALDRLVISPNSNRGGSTIKVIASETGHPTGGGSGAARMVNVFHPMSGGNDANIANAQAYNQNIINKVKSGNGTPLRPDEPLEAYLFALIDEDKKCGNATEQHYGLYTTSLVPKYQLSF